MRRHGLSGQAAIEFLLILPFLLLALSVTVDASRLFLASSSAEAAASDAARWAASQLSGRKSVSLKDVQDYCRSTGMVSDDASISFSASALGDSAYTIRLLGDDGSTAKEQQVRDKLKRCQVTVSVPVDLIIGVGPLADGSVNGVRTMTSTQSVVTTSETTL